MAGGPLLCPFRIQHSSFRTLPPMALRIDIVSLFPELYATLVGTSIPKRAAEKGLVEYQVTDLRPFGQGRHHKVDDRPFGGGPGMVMTAPVLAAAVDAAESADPRPARRILLTPVGQPFTHARALDYARRERLLLIATHYEGYDERFVEDYQPDLVSLGDFVLSGGELAAMVVLDAVVRLVPGVLGHDEGAAADSFAEGSEGLLDHPHYTRPPVWRGRGVPDVLLGGNHSAIEQWRREQRETRTREHRPDLWAPYWEGRRPELEAAQAKARRKRERAAAGRKAANRPQATGSDGTAG